MTDIPPRPFASKVAANVTGNGAYAVFLVDAEERKLAMFYSSRARSESTVKLVEFIAYACNNSEPPPS